MSPVTTGPGLFDGPPRACRLCGQDGTWLVGGLCTRCIKDGAPEVELVEETPDDFLSMAGNERLRRAAMSFHAENPQVYQAFVRFAFQAIESGREHFGVAMIWERMRWYTNIETRGEPWKLNNNHRAYYARMFMEQHPEHEGLFETRILREAL